MRWLPANVETRRRRSRFLGTWTGAFVCARRTRSITSQRMHNQSIACVAFPSLCVRPRSIPTSTSTLHHHGHRRGTFPAIKRPTSNNPTRTRWGTTLPVRQDTCLRSEEAHAQITHPACFSHVPSHRRHQEGIRLRLRRTATNKTPDSVLGNTTLRRLCGTTQRASLSSHVLNGRGMPQRQTMGRAEQGEIPALSTRRGRRLVLTQARGERAIRSVASTPGLLSKL